MARAISRRNGAIHRNAQGCPSCGAGIIAGGRFCHLCGTLLAVPSGEERKTVTVLFADIRGSTQLTAGFDPEQTAEALALAIGVMSETVRRFGGVVNRIMGDGVMALFGAPRAQEDHALRACCAAVAMVAAVRVMGPRLGMGGADGNSELLIRVGVSSGEVLFQPVRNDLGAGWDASGEAVVIAARMEQMATPGEAWATSETLHLVRGAILAKPLGTLTVKGIARPIETFRIEAVDHWRSRLQVAAERHGLSKFVGRQSELAKLAAILKTVRSGNGTVVGLVGDAGCGKSRLIREFLALPDTKGCLVLAGACASATGARTGYLPVLGMARAFYGILETDDAASVRARIRSRLEPRGSTITAAIQPLLAMLGAADSNEAAAWLRLAPEERARRIIEACLTLVRHEAARRPMILLVEDLHWVDPETEALISRLISELPDLPILLLMTYRPDYTPPWSRKRAVAELQISPLRARGAYRLAQSLLGGTRMTAPLARLLVSRTAGNPLFIEESVIALVEQGVLHGTHGAYQLVAGRNAAEGLATPPTVRALLAERIDKLPLADKRVLETAAIIGPEFHPLVLAKAADMPGSAALAAVDRLRRVGFLGNGPLADAASLSFRHAMMQEAAYAGVPRARRRELHARVLGATERVYGERAAECAEALARHAMLGENWRSAILHACRAAERASSRDANVQAVSWYEEALAALAHLPDDDSLKVTAAIKIRMAARDPLFRLGQIDRALALMREAKPLVTQLGNNAQRGQLAIFISHLAWLSGDHAAAIAEAERAHTIARESGDPALAARADFQIASGAFGQGDFVRAAQMMQLTAERAVMPEVVDRYGLDAPLAVVALGYRARALSELGEFEIAEEAVDTCALLAASVRRPFTSIFAAIAAGHLCLAGGRCDDAIEKLKEAVALCHQADAALLLPVATALLGSAEVAAGDVTEGLRLLRLAVSDAERIGLLFHQPHRIVLLCRALLAAGRPAEAGKLAARAAILADRQGERAAAAGVLLIRAHAVKEAGDYDQAQTLATKACAAARALGLKPLLRQVSELAAALV
jgi:class 3 adenylate cyclase/tetratricopeptide (TPR) repeat protein/ABC-type Mn2+/Zn2+ transport system ATPase subunit